jgi:hypothetical protein
MLRAWVEALARSARADSELSSRRNRTLFSSYDCGALYETLVRAPANAL